MTGAVSRIVLARPLILIVSWCGIASSTTFRASVAAIIICQNIAQQSSRRCATHCEQGVALGQYRASSGAQSSTRSEERRVGKERRSARAAQPDTARAIVKM